jgi:hypothetical protein
MPGFTRSNSKFGDYFPPNLGKLLKSKPFNPKNDETTPVFIAFPLDLPFVVWVSRLFHRFLP